MFASRKLLVGLMGLGVCSLSYAYPGNFSPDTNFYVGVQGGYANTHYTKSWLLKKPGFVSVGSVKTTGVAGRALLGYDFTKYVGAEAGYLWLSPIKFKNINGTTDKDMQQRIADVVGKLSLPLGDWFSFYGDAGAGYVMRSHINVSSTAKYDPNHRYVPVAGAGVACWLGYGFNTTLSENHYFSTGNFKATDFVALGLNYKF